MYPVQIWKINLMDQRQNDLDYHASTHIHVVYSRDQTTCEIMMSFGFLPVYLLSEKSLLCPKCNALAIPTAGDQLQDMAKSFF